LFSRDVKNCLTRNVKNYSVRSACGSDGKPIRAEAWGMVLAGSALPTNYVITHAIATHRPLHSHAYKNAGRIGNTMLGQKKLRHHGDQNWPPRREHDIANRVGHRVAQSREVALRLFLDCPKRSGNRPRAGTST